MGDMGDLYRDWEKHKRDQRQKNLTQADPSGWTRHTEYHWSRILLGDRLDYWPSKKKFGWRKRIHVGDVQAFILKHETDK